MAQATLLPFLPRAVLDALAPMDNLRTCERVSAATCVLHGTDDDIVPFDQGEHVAAALTGGAFTPIDGAGHNDILSPPFLDVVVDRIVDLATRPALEARSLSSHLGHSSSFST